LPSLYQDLYFQDITWDRYESEVKPGANPILVEKESSAAAILLAAFLLLAPFNWLRRNKKENRAKS